MTSPESMVSGSILLEDEHESSQDSRSLYSGSESPSWSVHGSSEEAFKRLAEKYRIMKAHIHDLERRCDKKHQQQTAEAEELRNMIMRLSNKLTEVLEVQNTSATGSYNYSIETIREVWWRLASSVFFRMDIDNEKWLRKVEIISTFKVQTGEFKEKKVKKCLEDACDEYQIKGGSFGLDKAFEKYGLRVFEYRFADLTITLAWGSKYRDTGLYPGPLQNSRGSFLLNRTRQESPEEAKEEAGEDLRESPSVVPNNGMTSNVKSLAEEMATSRNDFHFSGKYTKRSLKYSILLLVVHSKARSDFPELPVSQVFRSFMRRDEKKNRKKKLLEETRTLLSDIYGSWESRGERFLVKVFEDQRFKLHATKEDVEEVLMYLREQLESARGDEEIENNGLESCKEDQLPEMEKEKTSQELGKEPDGKLYEDKYEGKLPENLQPNTMRRVSSRMSFRGILKGIFGGETEEQERPEATNAINRSQESLESVDLENKRASEDGRKSQSNLVQFEKAYEILFDETKPAQAIGISKRNHPKGFQDPSKPYKPSLLKQPKLEPSNGVYCFSRTRATYE